MQQLQGHGPPSDYVVTLRNWRIQSEPVEHRCLRLYMEPCLGGDLYGILGLNRGLLPEPFLWYCFEALTNVGLLAQHGRLDGRPRRGHKRILHRDFKTPNVFCGNASKSKFRGYPTPKLGDWGLAVVMDENESDQSANSLVQAHRDIDLWKVSWYRRFLAPLIRQCRLLKSMCLVCASISELTSRTSIVLADSCMEALESLSGA
nr:hypothetical protein CFP56_07832 [Quercus suber]